jgi:primase-polymerase (primpol)-like protein
MRRILAFLTLTLLIVSVASAQFEVDDDMMRGIEDTTKSLDSNIAQREAKAAAAEAKELAGLFAQIETYYAGKSDGAEGVAHSQKSRELALATLKGIEAQDFDTAANTLNTFTRTCKACHQVYKKE